MDYLPFEASLDEIQENPDSYIDSIFFSLKSEFLVMPKGTGFVDYPVFENAYEVLKAATKGFCHFDAEKVVSVALSCPVVIVVLRSMLGFSPPEWGYVTTRDTGVTVSQGFVRALDRKVRMATDKPLDLNERLEALIRTACDLLSSGAPSVGADQLHRLDKADTREGAKTISTLADIGVPYAMLLYERFLGRPFASHRDSISELIGDSLEGAIENVLSKFGISFRKTGRAERITGFDQAPDFIIPSEFNPKIVIEAKITEDDGTARDKVTRIQHLGELSLAERTGGKPKFEVIACIGGRGFGVRREDMKKMLFSTRGKVFTLKTLDRLVACTELKNYCTR